MSRYHGVTAKTYKKVVIDSGEVRLGYVDETTRGTNLGATRGGSTFAIETEYRDMGADGAKGPVKGSRRIVKVSASIEANFLELSPDLIALALPGSAQADFPVGTPTHKEITRALQIALTDYQTSVALIGEVAGSATLPFVGILSNVIADGNFEVSASDAEECVCKIKFTAHFDPAALDTEPWTIRYPTDVLA